jgi:hypothetical protein
MRKIPTLFQRDPDDRRHVLPEVTPGCEWVLAGEGTPTRKCDGTCVMYDGLTWWGRREVKPGKPIPPTFQAIGTDEVTGKTVGWEAIPASPFFRMFDEARQHGEPVMPEGTYELIGPKINGNPEQYDHHALIRHADAPRLQEPTGGRTFEAFKALMASSDLRFPFEGIVWHHPDGRMAKLKARDFR